MFLWLEVEAAEAEATFGSCLGQCGSESGNSHSSSFNRPLLQDIPRDCSGNQPPVSLYPFQCLWDLEKAAWAPAPPQPLTHGMISSKYLTILCISFLVQKMEKRGCYPIVFLWGIKERIHVNHVEHSLTHGKYIISLFMIVVSAVIYCLSL